MAEDAEDRKKAARRAYYAANRDKQRADADEWKRQNPDRVREHRRKAARRAYARGKTLKAKRVVKQAWEERNRDAIRARQSLWRAANPDRIRQAHLRYVQRNPERARAVNRAASQRWRDANAEQARETGRAQAAARRERNPEEFRAWYQANLERERERGREKARLRSRLKKAGLPPPQHHRVYAADRRANLTAADEFFARRRRSEDKGRLSLEAGLGRDAEDRVPLPPHALAARHRLIEALSYEPTPAHEAARIEARAIELDARDRLPGIIASNRHRHAARLREEARLDSIARQARGLPPTDLDAEVERRVRETALGELARPLQRATRLRALADAAEQGKDAPDAEDTARAREAVRAALLGQPGTRAPGRPPAQAVPARPATGAATDRGMER